MESAEEIFVESKFTQIILQMQTMEKELAFDNSTLPDWYTQKDEPKSRAGVNFTNIYLSSFCANILVPKNYKPIM
jgi:hypothetical protein